MEERSSFFPIPVTEFGIFSKAEIALIIYRFGFCLFDVAASLEDSKHLEYSSLKSFFRLYLVRLSVGGHSLS